VQTTGGRTGMPARDGCAASLNLHGRRLGMDDAGDHLHSSGKIESDMIGASRFPRHWCTTSRVPFPASQAWTDFRDWYTRSPGPQHALGRPGLRGARATVEERAGALPVRLAHAREQQAAASSAWPPHRRHGPGRAGEDMCLVSRRCSGRTRRRATGGVRTRGSAW